MIAFNDHHRQALANLRSKDSFLTYMLDDETSLIEGNSPRDILRRRNRLEFRRNELKAGLSRARRRYASFCDDTAFSNVAEVLPNHECVHGLVDDTSLKEMLFSDRDDSGPGDDMLLFLAQESSELSTLLVRSILARHLIFEKYGIGDDMQAEFHARTQLINDHNAAIEDALRRGAQDNGQEIRERKEIRSRMVAELWEHRNRWQAVEDSLAAACPRLEVLDKEAFRKICRTLKGTQLLEDRVDLAKLKRQLFEGEHIPTEEDPHSPTHAASSPSGTFSEPGPDETQSIREAARKAREGAFAEDRAAKEKLDQHLASYSRMLNSHQKGEDPGLPGWDPSWSKTDFDLNRLQFGQKLTREVIDSEKRLYHAMKNARDAQVEPNEYMRAAFPDLSEDGQHSGDHQMAIVKAPRDAIYNWMNKIPVTPLGAGDSELKTTPSSVPHLRSPPKWESLSNVAGDFDAKLIRKYTGPRGPRGETPGSRSELKDVDDVFK
ncbi:hypothetical protein HII31_11300 [Pseudocercospora fuligena]|uniref:Uncharacterized protein n=1 Tax=Pseudocercospora fuligena TaxID=685502 RepID=A0A8H6R7L4_9PEZI|nr:hypothetical protein HII31_11300 [Pseudocercospora fuligena]